MAKMNYSLGFSICDHPGRSTELVSVLQKMLSLGCSAIELAPLSGASEQYAVYSPDFITHVLKFPYRSIHLPVYADFATNQKAIDYFLKLAGDINAVALTLHPISPTSALGLHKFFGKKLSIENMDWQKKFGQTVDDLASVFEHVPDATWTYDVNHVLTNDKSLKLGKDLMQALGDRLSHYHLSGFGGENLPHTLLMQTGQDQMLKLITQNKPIIIESFGETNIAGFEPELEYIKSRILN